MPEFMLLTVTPFVAILQKTTYHARCLRISWTYLDLHYRFGSHIGGDDYSNISLAVAQVTLLWQPVKFGDVRRRRTERSLLFALAFDNELADCQATYKRFNCNNPTTLCTNLVNFCPIISEFMLLKCTILPQFRHNLMTIFIRHVHIPKWIGRSQF